MISVNAIAYIIRFAMDSKMTEDFLEKLADITISLDQDIADLRISIATLTAVVANQINPDDPAAGVQHIHSLEAATREADPNAEQRQRVSDVVQALKLIRKHGPQGIS